MSNIKNPMKILIISLEYSPTASGGVGTHVEELSSSLAQAGDSVTVVAGTLGQPAQFTSGNKTVHLVPPGAGRYSAKSVTQGILDYNRVLAAYAQEKAMRDWRPDLIHCHNWITYPAANEIARRTGIPVIGTVHYLSHPVEPWWGQIPDPEIMEQEGNFLRAGKTFIAVSRSMRSLLREAYSVPESRVRVIYNGVNANSFLPVALSQEDRVRLRKAVAPANEKIVLYAGRLHAMKGVTALLKSAVLVLQKETRVRYVMAGEPDSQAFALELRSLLEQSPLLKKKVMMLGKLSRPRLATLYSIADVALVPSVYDPGAYAAIEAMVAGVPVIASNGGGLAELVQDRVNGLTVPVYANGSGLRSVDPEELAQATLTLLRHEDLARELGNAGRRKAAEVYSPEVMACETREAYEDALSRTRSHVA
jgi:glycogen synthase